MSALVGLLQERVALLALLGLCFALGFRRGIRRELTLLVGVGVGWGLARVVGPDLIRWGNGVYKGLRFLVLNLVGRGDPDALWMRVQGLPDPLEPHVDARLAALGAMGLAVVVAYLVGERRYPSPAEAGARLLGGLTGAVNGWLVAREVVRQLGYPAPDVMAPMTHAAAEGPAGNSTALAVVLIAALLIAFGLYSARHPGHRRPPGA